MKKNFSLNNFSFSFSASHGYFFNPTSLTFDGNEIIFLEGKNGAGKSTFFRLLQGSVHPQECALGTIRINDQIYNLENTQDRAGLYDYSICLHQGFDSMLAPSFTGFQNLSASTFSTYPGLGIAPKTTHLPKLAEYFNVPFEKPVRLLSGGQRQLLSLIMLSERKVNLLLLDEPTASLDQVNIQRVMECIKQFAHETHAIVFCISHDQESVARYAKQKLRITELPSGERMLEKIVTGL